MVLVSNSALCQYVSKSPCSVSLLPYFILQNCAVYHVIIPSYLHLQSAVRRCDYAKQIGYNLAGLQSNSEFGVFESH